MKNCGETGERGAPVSPFFPVLFRSLFSAPLPYSWRLSPLSERLEQAKSQTGLCTTEGWLVITRGKNHYWCTVDKPGAYTVKFR